MLQFTFRSFFDCVELTGSVSCAELHFVPVLDEPTQPNQETELASSTKSTDQRELDEVKSKASAHSPAHLPAGFSGRRSYTDLKNRQLGKI